MEKLGLSGAVFLLTLALTFAAAAFARIKSARSSVHSDHADEDLAGRGLNRWLVGLSAATTGNSGFIVTGAVGLGYAGGMQWLLFPMAWLLGDLIYWGLFPDRLNAAARNAQATTLSELLTHGLSGRTAKLIAVASALLLVVFLSMYTSAQWLAGKKFLSGVFDLSEVSALLLFGGTIVLYSSLGGFRGSVYTDTVQAVIRIFGTVVALGAVAWFALSDQAAFSANLESVGPEFWRISPHGSLLAAAGFVAGYAGAAIGFGLGQPQIVTRYMAGASPEETRAAKWIYIGFLQGTWLAMTTFGILLRGVMPDISDPETGLSLFFQSYMGPIATGIIFADVFATIASTSNGLLVAISQALRRDLLGHALGQNRSSLAITTAFTLVIGLGTIAMSFILPGSVFSIAVDAVSKIGAALAGPVMIKIFRWRHSGVSLLAAMLSGLAAAYAWTVMGYSPAFNEAGIGIAVSLLVNLLLSGAGKPADRAD